MAIRFVCLSQILYIGSTFWTYLHTSWECTCGLVLLKDSVDPRLAPSLCISYSTKSDIHGIIMNPQMGGDITVRDVVSPTFW